MRVLCHANQWRQPCGRYWPECRRCTFKRRPCLSQYPRKSIAGEFLGPDIIFVNTGTD